LPLTFQNPADYEHLVEGAVLEIRDVRQRIEGGAREIPVQLNGTEIITLLDVSPRQRDSLLAGGTLNQVRQEL
jgi:aconitate hydratase